MVRCCVIECLLLEHSATTSLGKGAASPVQAGSGKSQHTHGLSSAAEGRDDASTKRQQEVLRGGQQVKGEKAQSN